MFSGFIFDVEGTLIDSVSQNLRSLQDALERHGYRVPYQTLQLYSGLDGDQTLQLVAPDATEPERKEILKEQGAIYERSYLDSVRPFESVRSVFSDLTARGGKIALATDCKGLAFKRYLSLLDANEFIAGTVCGDDVDHGKPDPRLVGHALAKLRVPALKAVMIGTPPMMPRLDLRPAQKLQAYSPGASAQKRCRRPAALPWQMMCRRCFSVSKAVKLLSKVRPPWAG